MSNYYYRNIKSRLCDCFIVEVEKDNSLTLTEMKPVEVKVNVNVRINEVFMLTTIVIESQGSKHSKEFDISEDKLVDYIKDMISRAEEYYAEINSETITNIS
jgi:hypothetical protein